MTASPSGHALGRAPIRPADQAKQSHVSEGVSPPTSGLPPPGWYLDPARTNGGYRWWNGTAWTHQVLVFSPPGVPPAPGPRGDHPAGPVADTGGTPWQTGSSGPGAPTQSVPGGTEALEESWQAGPPNAPVSANRGPGPPAEGPGSVVAPGPDAGGLGSGAGGFGSGAAGPGWPATRPGVPEAPGPAGKPAIPLRAVWYAVFGLVVGELLGGILGGIAYAFTGDAKSAVVTLLGEIGLWMGMLGSVVFVSRRFGTGSLARDFSLRIRTRDLGFGILVAVVGTLLSAIASTAFSGTRFAGTNTQILTGQRHNSAGIAVVTVIVALGAPFFEELFFRGLLRTALAARFGPMGAVVAQGLLFGLAHYVPSNGLGNVSVIVTIAALGIILGYAAQRTGRLGAGMIGHGLFNLVAAIAVVTS